VQEVSQPRPVEAECHGWLYSQPIFNNEAEVTVTEQMKLYACRTFKPKYPVGHGAVVLAATKTEAAQMLRQALNQIILPSDIEEVSMQTPTIVMLLDGNY
jgi:IMP cyclohydrolase